MNTTQNTIAENVFHMYNNWPENVAYNSPQGWETEKDLVLAEIKASLPKSKGIQYDSVKAKQQCGVILQQLDKIELHNLFTDVHGHDVMANQSEAFYALQKAVAAFRELEAKF